MPGIGRYAERQQGAGRRRHLGDDVLEIVGGAQEPEPAALRFPTVVHVDQYGDELRAGIGMNAPVGCPRRAAHRDHRRPPLEVDCEFLGDGMAHLRSLELGKKALEDRADPEIGDGEAAGRLDCREILAESRQRRPFDKAGYDDMRERIGPQRRAVQRRQVEEMIGLAVTYPCCCPIHGLLPFPPCHKAPGRETMAEPLSGAQSIACPSAPLTLR